MTVAAKARKARKGFLLEILFYCIFLLAAAFFVYSQGQDRNWDLLNYHYYQGYSVLNGRFMVDIAAAHLQSFLNPMINIVAYLALTHLPFPVSAWIILLIQLACLPAIVLLAKEIGTALGYPASFITVIPAIALSLHAPLWASELGTSFSSSWTAPLIIWGVYFLFTANKGSGFSKSKIAIAGLLFGFAAGLKLTNAPFAVSAFLMIVVLTYRSGWRNLIFANVCFLATCGVGFGLTAWWNWHLWSVWGNPIFPLYNVIFKSEFYDVANFRDMRWTFSSLPELLIFIVQSSWGTTKTSEVSFADARYLILTLLIPAAILCRPAIRFNRALIGLVVFIASSFLLWCLLFAYQRYLIPVELLLGLLVWIMVVRIVESKWLRNAIMISLTFCVASLMTVPDWGHAPMGLGDKNPFSIEMNVKLSSTPARYVVIGGPISYVLPSFHPDSLFYGVGFSSQVDELVFNKIEVDSDLPLRFLAKDADSILIPERLRKVGYDPLKHSLDCEYFRTGIGRYIVCELQYYKLKSINSDSLLDIDLSENGYLKNGGILWERGLGSFEPWGRWSVGDLVEFGLSECLPQGNLKMTVRGHAFGPNVDLPVKVSFGGIEKMIKFADVDSQQTIYFMNHMKCLNKITITIPKPTSPQEVGLSTDTRKLGIGLISIKVIKE
jgi:hypothetical protein